VATRVSLRRYPSPVVTGSGYAGLNSSNAVGWFFSLGAFTALLAAVIALNSFKVGGFPIRAFATVGVLGIVGLLYTDKAADVFKRNTLLLTMALALAALGGFVSLIYGTSISNIGQALMEVHLQAMVTILAAGILARVCGAKAAATAIIAVVALSASVAALQMLGFHQAWDLRKALGPLPAEALEGVKKGALRPSGLSFSPIQLSTQLCLAFAAFAAVRDKVRKPSKTGVKPDPLILLGLIGLCAASFAVETRAPVVGAMIFLVIYAISRRSAGFALLLIMGGAFVYFVGPTLLAAIQGHAPRMTKVDDNSAVGRFTMAYYGIRLFLDNPLGYGLAFDPAGMWGKYWFDLYTMPAPMVVQVHDLHNFVLSMMNIYGVGLLLLAPLAWKLLRQSGGSLIFFIPYIFQILFHNSGPFYNDNLIWFVIAAIAAANVSAGPEVLAHVRAGGRKFALVRRTPRAAQR